MGKSSLPPLLIFLHPEVSLDSLLLHSFHVLHSSIPIPIVISYANTDVISYANTDVISYANTDVISYANTDVVSNANSNFNERFATISDLQSFETLLFVGAPGRKI
jgi:hypothetical protein